MLKIQNVDHIKKTILSEKKILNNFPKAITFEFDPFYREVATQVKTLELSSECILYASAEAVKVNANMSTDIMSGYWIFAQNGQGDLWLFDVNHQVYFYDHDLEDFCDANFIFLDIDFAKWLQFADLNHQFDLLYDENDVDENVKNMYQQLLTQLSITFAQNYPFEI